MTTPTDPTPHEGTPRALRWTEHGPEPVIEAPAPPVDAVTDAPSSPEPSDDIAALRARLAERGLVRTDPSLRIRDLAGDAPAVRPAEATPAEDPLPVVVPEDAEELEPEPLGATSSIACPSCRSSQEVSVGAAGYRCQSCTRVWRWAICSHCAELSLTLARQESWRCTPCGDYSRSWWRTVDGRTTAPTVVLRRQSEEAHRQRAAAHERARKRRGKVVLAGVALIAATATWAVGFADRGVPATQRGPTGAVCTTATDLRSAFAGGATDPAEVRAALDDLSLAATDAIPSVEVAAQRWAASGRPGDQTFEAAAKELAAACAAG